MSGSTLVALGALLIALLMAMAATMLWQEAKTRATRPQPIYGIEDAVHFIESHLATTTLTRSDIRRIIEWEVYYLQGLAQKSRRNPVETVAGGTSETIDYIQGRITGTSGVTYPREEIAGVLRLEADYLLSIGAVGRPVEMDEGDDE